LNNNDLLRRLRYALRCDDSQTSRLIKLGGGTTTTGQAARFRAKETNSEFSPCSSDVITCFLDGLIIDYRGPRENDAPSPWPDRSRSGQSEDSKTAKQVSKAQVSKAKDAGTGNEPERMDNNVVLKQLRIALSLRSDDVYAILQAGGSAMSASEASALFRRPDARNYRPCGDQVLRQFIAGLVKRREQNMGKQES